MLRARASTLLLAAALLDPPARAQEATPGAQQSDPPQAAQQEPPPSQPAEPPDDRRRDPDLLPSVDFYFPEGELDFRLNGLIKNAFYEGQVRYNFVEGDISAFLRYRYYGYSRTYLLGVFDEVEFEEIEKLDNDFQRVRGGLFLLQWPQSYHHRTFVLAEVDRITSNKEELRFSTNRTNTFLRIGHQIGTPNDERSNAIVGETRATVQRLFTTHRKIGPYGAGLTGALTWGNDFLGDFDYVKAEFEALKRFDLRRDLFLVSRVHGGTFLYKQLVRDDPELEPVERYSIPRGEFFRLDGRENLKGLKERLRGTEELHATAELFFPWFVEKNRRAIGLQWQTWYWILYGGYGTIGFDREVFTDEDTYVPDIGVGFETAVALRKYTFFLSGIVAESLRGEGGVEARLSVKSYH